MSMQADHYDELGQLQEVLNVYQELGGEKEVAQLVTPDRRLIHCEDAVLRLHKRDATKRECRIYVFNDLFLLGIKKPGNRKQSTPTSLNDITWFGEVRQRGSSVDSDVSYDSDESGDSGKTTGSDKEKKSNDSKKAAQKVLFKLKMWMDLNKVTPKPFSKDGEHGIYLTYVTRVQIELEDGSVRWDTSVDRTELWCENHEVAKRIYEKLQEAVDDIAEKIIRGEDDEASKDGASRRSSSTASEAGAPADHDGGESVNSKGSGSSKGSGGQRKWVKAKKTMEKQRAFSRSSKYSYSSSGPNSPEAAGVISMNDIEDRYEAFEPTPVDVDELEAEFTVTFNNPSMGLALSSGDGIGPFVVKLEKHGLAKQSGVTVGDRIIQVNDQKIEKSMTWQECVEIMKKQEKPVIITFSRREQTENELLEKKKKVEQEKLDESTKQAVEEGQTKRKKTGKRSWAKKKDRKRSYGNRIMTLEDLAEAYLNKGAGEKLQQDIDEMFVQMVKESESSEEKQCTKVLEEIHHTERRYVEVLAALVHDYLRPIKIKYKPVRCKELQNGRPFCEHRMPRRLCNEISTKKRVPLLSESDLSQIFLNVEVLLKVNMHLIQRLQNGLKDLIKEKQEGAKKIKVYDVVGVYAPAFEKVTPYFQIYWQYCQDYSRAVSHLLQVRRANKEFADVLDLCEKRAKTQTLQSLLIQPVQRLCKYPLLFQQLTSSIRKYIEANKNAPEPQKDVFRKMLGDLETCERAVRTVADKVNDKVGEHQSLEKLAEVYAELGGQSQIKDLVKPYRRFVLRKDIGFENKTVENKDTTEAVLFLFNDLMVVATTKQGPRNSSYFPSKLAKISSVISKNQVGSSVSYNPTKSRNSTRRTSKASVGKASRRSTEQLVAAPLDVIQQAKLKNCDKFKMLDKPNPDGRYGLAFWATEHYHKDVEKTENGKKTSITHIDTAVNNLQFWLDTEEQRNDLYQAIIQAKETLKANEAEYEEAKRKHGAGKPKRKRKYVTRLESKADPNGDMTKSKNRTQKLKDMQKTMKHGDKGTA